MRTRTFLIIFVGILAVASLLWIGKYAYDNIVLVDGTPVPPANFSQTTQPGLLTAFLVVRPDLIVDSANLSRVEIWAVPMIGENTEVEESDYILLGEPTLQSGSTLLTQIWALPIPQDSLDVSEIYAKGFDMQGDFVGQLSLPYIGTTQVFNALWAELATTSTPSRPDTQSHFSFVLGVGESIEVGGLSVKLIQVENDSRCPLNAICIWAGEVTAKVQLAVGDRSEFVNLHSMSSPSIFENYEIGITVVAPAKQNTPIQQEEYQLTFSVERL